jgi:hypothetical protein
MPEQVYGNRITGFTKPVDKMIKSAVIAHKPVQHQQPGQVLFTLMYRNGIFLIVDFNTIHH